MIRLYPQTIQRVRGGLCPSHPPLEQNPWGFCCRYRLLLKASGGRSMIAKWSSGTDMRRCRPREPRRRCHDAHCICNVCEPSERTAQSSEVE